MKPLNVNVGDKVMAVRAVTEDGVSTPNPHSNFPALDYIHALPGDMGTVVHTEEGLHPTVCFERTGTMTCVTPKEVTTRTDIPHWLQDGFWGNGAVQ